MFTGIIEEVGEIQTINQANESLEFDVKASIVTKDLKLGDSISVNGVCLTATSFTDTNFTMDVMPETSPYRIKRFKSRFKSESGTRNGSQWTIWRSFRVRTRRGLGENIKRETRENAGILSY